MDIGYINFAIEILCHPQNGDESEIKGALAIAVESLKTWRKMLEQEPCDDAISRQAVIKYIEASDAELGHSSENELVCQDIKELPPVTPQPKTGYWIEKDINEWSRKVFCSECGCPPPFEHVSNGDVYSASGYGVVNKTKFCPSCGTRMVEPQESEDKGTV